MMRTTTFQLLYQNTYTQGREGIQHEYEHDLCSQPLLIFLHSLNYKSELANRDNASEHRLVIHDNDIWLSKQYGRLNDLYYEN